MLPARTRLGLVRPDLQMGSTGRHLTGRPGYPRVHHREVTSAPGCCPATFRASKHSPGHDPRRFSGWTVGRASRLAFIRPRSQAREHRYIPIARVATFGQYEIAALLDDAESARLQGLQNIFSFQTPDGYAE
jgi:hypothetical protein